MALKKYSYTYPGRLLLIFIITFIMVGAIILSLPICYNGNASFLDFLFISASSTCVTGLETIPFDNFTFSGQVVIAILSQLGGLGLMTLTLMIISLFINIGLSTQLMAGQLLEIDNLRNVKRMFIFTFIFSAIVETIGAVGIFFSLGNSFDLKNRILYSIFHSITSFCNAGIILKPVKNIFYHNNFIMILIALMVTIGGLGFFPWYEVFLRIKRKLKNKKRIKFSLHTKIAISLTLILTSMSTGIFLILEYNNTLRLMPWYQKIIYSIFNGAAFRSSGFLTVPFFNLQLATILLIMIISSIGTSPGSTGSGIKTSVFAIFLATVRSVMTAKKNVRVFNRCIMPIQIYKSLTIITVSISWIILTSFFLMITENNFTFLEILFESTSAFMNLGISSGITSSLSPIGKIFIIISMVLGRIGSLTVALSFIKSREVNEFSYPEEKIMLS